MNHGYTNVVNMEHGMIRWATKGFPTKGDASSVLENKQNTGCCDTSSNSSSESCCTPAAEKEKVNTNDSGSCDCSKPNCC